MSNGDITVLMLPVTPCVVLEAFRMARVPAKAKGLGLHISLLGFGANKIDTQGELDIGKAVDQVAPFKFTLAQFCIFPDARAIYLAPYPVTPLEQLRNRLLERFPDHQPQFPQHIFHVTIASGFAFEEISTMMSEAHEQLDHLLPFECCANELVMMDRIAGVWMVRKRFELGRQLT